MQNNDIEKRIISQFTKIGFVNLTNIQKQSYSIIRKKKNLLLVAPTGSGKTEAAIIPIIVEIINNRPEKNKVSVLYITPLRALNRDIFERIIKYTELEGVTAEVRHGDTTRIQKRRMIENPPDVLITTPETLAILVTNKSTRVILSSVKWTIIDEFHELIGNERGTQLTLSLERLQKLSSNKIVRIGLSATIGDVNNSLKLLSGNNNKYFSEAIIDSTVREYDIEIKYLNGNLVDLSNLVLKYVLEKRKTTLLFTNTRVEAEAIGSILKAKSPEFPVEVHHGSLAKEVRENTELKLKSNEPVLVVCTSSLELGLDIGSVDSVIQLGSPRQAIKLIQRIGRSRHKVGQTAKGIIFTNKIDDEIESLALVNRIKDKDLESISMHEKSLDVLSHQITGMVMENENSNINDVFFIVKNAYPFRNITKEELVECVIFLQKHGIIGFNGEKMWRRSRIFEYYYQNISTIPDSLQFTVRDITKKKIIGRLDQLFVGEYGEPGKTFILKGNSWRIISIDDEKKIVHVEPIFTDITNIPHWIGELIPVDFGTAQRVEKLREEIFNQKINTSPEQKERIVKTFNALNVIPNNQNIIIEKNVKNKSVILHCCFGSKINQTIATLLSTIISSKSGVLIDAKTDPYRILLSSQGLISENNIEDAIINEIELEEILKVAIVGSHPLNWKIWHVSKRFGVIKKEAEYDRRAVKLIQKRYKNTPLYKEVIRELILEKYDMVNTKKILQKIRQNKIKIIFKSIKEFTPLAKPILEHASTFAALPLTVEKSIIDLIKKRLEETNNKLMCISCGKWETVIKPINIKQKNMGCKICKSKLITRTFVTDYDLLKIINKKKKGKQLTDSEEISFKKAWKVSSLIQHFDKKAIITLSGFGIGPVTAARILRNTFSEEDLFKKIYVAEKLYVTTRGFWKE